MPRCSLWRWPMPSQWTSSSHRQTTPTACATSTLMLTSMWVMLLCFSMSAFRLCSHLAFSRVRNGPIHAESRENKMLIRQHTTKLYFTFYSVVCDVVNELAIDTKDCLVANHENRLQGHQYKWLFFQQCIIFKFLQMYLAPVKYQLFNIQSNCHSCATLQAC